MSYSLTINGHSDDPETAALVDQILAAKGIEVVAELAGVGVTPSSAMSSGPTQSVNFLTPPAEDQGPDDGEPATDGDAPEPLAEQADDETPA
jgi:hypothetical protein